MKILESITAVTFTAENKEYREAGILSGHISLTDTCLKTLQDMNTYPPIAEYLKLFSAYADMEQRKFRVHELLRELKDMPPFFHSTNEADFIALDECVPSLKVAYVNRKKEVTYHLLEAMIRIVNRAEIFRGALLDGELRLICKGTLDEPPDWFSISMKPHYHSISFSINAASPHIVSFDASFSSGRDNYEISGKIFEDGTVQTDQATSQETDYRSSYGPPSSAPDPNQYNITNTAALKELEETYGKTFRERHKK